MSRRSRPGIEKSGGPHRFDSYGEFQRVAGCTRKVRFATEDEAIGAAIRVSCNSGRPMRTYKCDRCGGYHLTSQVAR